MICLDAFQSKKHLTAIFWTFELSSTSSLSSIWLKYGMKSYFMVKSRNGYKKFQLFLLAKKRESALGLPILARQHGGSKVIFWIELGSYRKDFSKYRDIPETIFPSP